MKIISSVICVTNFKNNKLIVWWVFSIVNLSFHYGCFLGYHKAGKKQMGYLNISNNLSELSSTVTLLRKNLTSDLNFVFISSYDQKIVGIVKIKMLPLDFKNLDSLQNNIMAFYAKLKTSG